MIDLSRVEKYYVACGYTDMRRGIDGLAAIVSQQFGAPLRQEQGAYRRLCFRLSDDQFRAYGPPPAC